MPKTVVLGTNVELDFIAPSYYILTLFSLKLEAIQKKGVAGYYATQP
jgi:hypothetical protein